jgi:two-component system sensor histidine kinase UhpB
MRTLAADENTRLVTALAQLVALRLENVALQQHVPLDQIAPSDLDLQGLLDVRHADAVLLVDESGKPVFMQGNVPSGNPVTDWLGVPEALAGQTGALFTDDSNAGDVVAYAPVSAAGWALVIREPWHSLTDPLIRFEQVIPFVLFSAVAISLLTLFFGVRYVVQPLRELRQRANLIGQGKFDTPIKPSGAVSEIADLRLTLNEMAQRIQRDQAALQEYLRAVTQAQEEERERIARELHDETVQTLIALGHKAQMAQRSLTRDPEQTPTRIGELRDMIAQAIEEVRRFSQALHPHYLEELGLVAGLEMLSRETGAVLEVSGSPHRLKAEKELAIYRIAQEALNNARRHAQATSIRLEIRFAEKQVVVCVQDDGRGFDVPNDFSSLTHSGHYGLIGIRERSQLVGGHIEVESQPSRGTTVRFRLEA